MDVRCVSLRRGNSDGVSANVALTFANSTIFFSLFHFHRASVFFLLLLRPSSFLCRWKKFIENPLERFRQNHKQSKSLILMGRTHTHTGTHRPHLYNMSGVYRPKVKYVCEFAKWKWNPYIHAKARVREWEANGISVCSVCNVYPGDLSNSMCALFVLFFSNGEKNKIRFGWASFGFLFC